MPKNCPNSAQHERTANSFMRAIKLGMFSLESITSHDQNNQQEWSDQISWTNAWASQSSSAINCDIHSPKTETCTLRCLIPLRAANSPVLLDDEWLNYVDEIYFHGSPIRDSNAKQPFSVVLITHERSVRHFNCETRSIRLWSAFVIRYILCAPHSHNTWQWPRRYVRGRQRRRVSVSILRI